MKQITFKNDEISTIAFDDLLFSSLIWSIVTAKYKNDKYLLTYQENDGWVFLKWNETKFGHSGSHRTQLEAIKRAKEILEGTEIFIFDTLQEAVDNFFNK